MKVDIGCGSAKKPGHVGVDIVAGDGVDHVVDVEREALPFPDRSVDAIFTSHCLEHLADHSVIFREMSRVAKNGASLEIWTPYAWSDEAFIYTHRTFFNELHYLHPCYLFEEHWRDILGARWQLKEFQFIVKPETLHDLERNGVSLDFALKYMKGVAVEFGTHIAIWHEGAPAGSLPLRTYSEERNGGRRSVESSDRAAAPSLWRRLAQAALARGRR
jgi:predicted SAM-dependent methyltransferase